MNDGNHLRTMWSSLPDGQMFCTSCGTVPADLSGCLASFAFRPLVELSDN
jgi:hypothetical protein